MDGKISNQMEIASLRRYIMKDGVGAGLEVIDCDNGNIRFLINVSKAADIMQLYHKGQNMSFVSKNGFIKRELDFDRQFEGGMLYTCGLDSLGDREGYATHGTVHNIPAQITRAICDGDGICVEAVIRDTAIFGKNLVLKRRIFSSILSDTVSVEDTLVNEGYRDEEYCILYHVNIGYPMLDDGARIVADTEACVPRTPWAAENESTAFVMETPIANFEECCYFLSLRSPRVSLVNERMSKTFTVEYSADTLPCFVEWKSRASGDFALGLEPCTSELDGGFKYRNIAPGEKIKFKVDIAVNDN